jgi:choline monooxygenase
MAVLSPPLGLPARITPVEYTSAAIAAEERARLFGSAWQLVGFTDEVAEHGRSIAETIAGVPVIVVNIGGTLRGCRNLCPGCHGRLVAVAEGLGCPRCGIAAFAGDNPFEAAVDSCGRFIFLRLGDGPELRDFLAPLYDTLAELSETFTDPGEDSLAVWDCNWKIAVESAIEVYHAKLVHPTTLLPYAPEGTDFQGEVFGEHSFGCFGIAAESAEWWNRVAKRLKLTRLERYPAYDHFHIFPNLLIPISSGALMAVQTYEPAGAGVTRMRYRLRFGAAQGPQNAAIRREIEASLARFNQAVIAEDVDITRRVQQGAGDAERPGMLGTNEWRIRNFQSAYRRWMDR